MYANKTTGVNKMLNRFGDTFDEFDKTFDMFDKNLDEVFKEHDNRMAYMNAIFEKQSKPRFEFVSFQQFKDDMIATFDEYDNSEDSIDELKAIYNDISIPKRSTKHSAGYDFKSPFYFALNPGKSIMVPTGIRAYMPSNMVLMIFPRSGLGTKFHMSMANTVGIIDSDYFYADNEGHIHLKMVNNGDKQIQIDAGKAFAQGIFTQYFTTEYDDANGVRHGGMGSTDKK